MSCEDLKAAAKSARHLVSIVTSIRALPAAGASKAAVTKLVNELNQDYPEARAAIGKVTAELRLSRLASGMGKAQFGDIVAATAHEVAVKMVLALNRERFKGIEIVGRKQVQEWPDREEVMTEIELELTSAQDRRESARVAAKTLRKQRGVTDTEKKRRRRSTLQTKPLTLKQIEALKHHGDCAGKIAEIARRMDVTRKTAEQHVKAAFTKLGKSVPTKPKTTSLKTDRRGQVDVSRSDDHRG